MGRGGLRDGANTGSSATLLAVSAVLGLGFLLIPIQWGGRWTVAFDLIVRVGIGLHPQLASVYALSLVVLGAVGGTVARRGRGPQRLALLRCGPLVSTSRWLAIGLAIAMVGGWGPAWLLAPSVEGLIGGSWRSASW